MQTTAGSHTLSGSIVPSEAKVVKNLRAAGAIIIGKANIQELSGMRDGEIKGEWSGRGGYCYSAYVEKGDPKGSSGGSAVAVSAGFAADALGGDTTGSITWPAGRAACYAMRPTVGLVPTEGCIPLSSSMDVLGPMGKSAYDVAVSLTYMIRDPKDVSFREYSRFRRKDRYAESHVFLVSFRHS
jgi:amidase